MLVAAQQTGFDFALQVFADVGAQTVHRAFGNAQRDGQCVVHLWQVRRFDLLQGDHEVRRFACHVFAMVFGWKGQRESLAFAKLHATGGVFKLFEHLAVTQDELEVFGFAAFEGLTVDFSFKVHGDAVAVLGRCVMGAQGKRAALFAQDVDGFVDGGVCDLSVDGFHFGTGQVANHHFGKHFKNGVKRHLAFGGVLGLRNAGLTGHAQLGFIGGGGERLAHLVIHHFVVHRITVALGHHVHGHLAGTKTIHLHGAGHFAQARVDL